MRFPHGNTHGALFSNPFSGMSQVLELENGVATHRSWSWLADARRSFQSDPVSQDEAWVAAMLMNGIVRQPVVVHKSCRRAQNMRTLLACRHVTA